MNTKLTLVDKIALIVCAILAVVAVVDGTNSVKNVPTVTFDSQWMESFAEENGEDVIYWEIDWVGDSVCRRYEYTAHKKTKIHIYYECEDYSSGFEVVMNPETGRCTIWESGH
ncbi:MAG: hypothetical protein J6W35_07060 [Eubacterium sp.]|nr:hypothetical protein [Eubacterium sp.]